MSGSEGTTGIDISTLTQAAEELIDAVKAHVEVTSIAQRQEAVQQNHNLSSLEKNMTDKLTEMSTEIKTMVKLQRLDWAFANISQVGSFECIYKGNGYPVISDIDGYSSVLYSHMIVRGMLTAFRRNRGYCITDYDYANGTDGGVEFRAKITDQLDSLLGTTSRLVCDDGEWMIYYE